ncbi:hypothetical protein [Agromyces sp. Marseille-Q5079]|uniref:hypothetical protein n=1 Tax=Agromyces sp. Marseille-Q5079 TaxID=3439059 RepID=UPI003D9C9160
MTDLHDAITLAVLDAAALDRDILDGNLESHLTPEQHLALIHAGSDAEGEARAILRQAVESARAGGVSWAAIGAELGMSRQAAQQRFGDASKPDDAADDEAEYRWLGPVTAFDEMAELELAGRAGWHTVEAGMLRHRMVRTDTQWETKRLIWRGPSRRDEAEGWIVGSTMFPWAYLVRDLGIPAE